MRPTRVYTTPGSYPLLLGPQDPLLRYGLEKIAEEIGLRKAIQERRLSLALVDLTDRYHSRAAGINEDLMLYAASLPKVVILFALFKRLEEGSLIWDDNLLSLASDMIQISSNEAATKLFMLVGPTYILDLLRSPTFRLYDVKYGGGLWVGKEYGKGQAIEREPLKNLSHAASAMSVAHLYYLLERGVLLTPKWADMMRAVLDNSAFNNKLVKGYSRCCPRAQILRKSGTWRNFHSDSAIVQHGRHRYIIVVITDDPDGNRWIEELAPRVDLLVQNSNIAHENGLCPNEIKPANELPPLEPYVTAQSSDEEYL